MVWLRKHLFTFFMQWIMGLCTWNWFSQIFAKNLFVLHKSKMIEWKWPFSHLCSQQPYSPPGWSAEQLMTGRETIQFSIKLLRSQFAKLTWDKNTTKLKIVQSVHSFFYHNFLHFYPKMWVCMKHLRWRDWPALSAEFASGLWGRFPAGGWVSLILDCIQLVAIELIWIELFALI